MLSRQGAARWGRTVAPDRARGWERHSEPLKPLIGPICYVNKGSSYLSRHSEDMGSSSPFKSCRTSQIGSPVLSGEVSLGLLSDLYALEEKVGGKNLIHLERVVGFEPPPSIGRVSFR